MIIIEECNFDNSLHCNAVINLMNHYMSDEMGGRLPGHTREKSQLMIEGLAKHPSKLIVLANYDDEYVGLANCFINFATFPVKSFINPLYSWKSEVNSMNVCWVVGCKAGNPDLGILKFGLCNKSKFVGIP